MNKNLILSFISLVFSMSFFSCSLISKKDISQRSIASVNSNYSGENYAVKSKRLIKPVSTVVLIREGKPRCFVSAVKYPDIVPSYFPIASSQRPVDASLNLSECHSRDINAIQNVTQQAVLLDKKGGYKTAAVPLIAAAVCVGAAALGTGLSLYQHENKVLDLEKVFLKQ